MVAHLSPLCLDPGRCRWGGYVISVLGSCPFALSPFRTATGHKRHQQHCASFRIERPFILDQIKQVVAFNPPEHAEPSVRPVTACTGFLGQLAGSWGHAWLQRKHDTPLETVQQAMAKERPRPRKHRGPGMRHIEAHHTYARASAHASFWQQQQQQPSQQPPRRSLVAFRKKPCGILLRSDMLSVVAFCAARCTCFCGPHWKRPRCRFSLLKTLPFAYRSSTSWCRTHCL